ncbi:cupin domain-containing protein [Endozoicomonas arenosclerae]|uniref:cupin domain-containing protein n=1 Tax=Endozoicomonas arenosclerae TaxID=1633495 RepID=UPI00078036D7|nr:cupin domain-containing protein [Endozoicomonas arenosclerae]
MTNDPEIRNKELIDQLASVTADFCKPGILKEKAASPLLYSDIKTILHAVADKASVISPTLRLMKNHGVQLDLAQILIQNPPSHTERLEDWYYKIFKDDNICIIIGQLAGYFSDIVSRIKGIHPTLSNTVQDPFLTLQPSLLMGDYDFTPFGIHEDGYGVSVIHFHLGPCSKYMTFWSRDLLSELTGSSERFYASNPRHQRSYSSLIPLGETWCIEPGDVFYIPEDMPHIGHATGFSASFMIILERLTKSDWYGKALAQLLEHLENQQPLPNWLTDASKQFQQSVQNNSGIVPSHHPAKPPKTRE